LRIRRLVVIGEGGGMMKNGGIGGGILARLSTSVARRKGSDSVSKAIKNDLGVIKHGIIIGNNSYRSINAAYLHQQQHIFEKNRPRITRVTWLAHTRTRFKTSRRA